MDDAFARNARIATAEGNTALSEGGDALAHLAECDYLWFRPAAYTMMEGSLSDKARRMFPRGVRLCFVGDVYAEAVATSMDDELTIFHATEGDGQNRDGLGDWLIAVQEVFNNLMNMTQEYAEYGIPEVWHDEEIIDTDARQDRRSAPGDAQAFKRPTNMAAEDLFYEWPTANPPEFLIPFMEYLQVAFAQFVSSQQAAIFGKSDQHNETAKGIELLRDQALGLVGLVWMPFTIGWANVVKQAVKAAAKNRTGVISTFVPIPGERGKTEKVDVDAQDLQGNILAYPETDENFPETWTQKSNKIIQLFESAEKNPSFAPVALLPANQQLFKNATGLDELEIPGQASNDKQLAEIEQLLLTGPDMPQTATMPNDLAQPAQPQPTIPIDPIFDDSQAEWQAGLRWVNDEAGQKAKKENPGGFLNVRLHLLQHKQVVDQQQAQQMQQQMALKHGAPSQPDPQAQAAKAELLKDASDAIKQLDVDAHIPIAYTNGKATDQVNAAKAILDAALKASTAKAN